MLHNLYPPIQGILPTTWTFLSESAQDPPGDYNHPYEVSHDIILSTVTNEFTPSQTADAAGGHPSTITWPVANMDLFESVIVAYNDLTLSNFPLGIRTTMMLCSWIAVKGRWDRRLLTMLAPLGCIQCVQWCHPFFSDLFFRVRPQKCSDPSKKFEPHGRFNSRHWQVSGAWFDWSINPRPPSVPHWVSCQRQCCICSKQMRRLSRKIPWWVGYNWQWRQPTSRYWLG